MEPLAAVKNFDQFKYSGSGFRSGGKLVAMHQLAFEAVRLVRFGSCGKARFEDDLIKGVVRAA